MPKVIFRCYLTSIQKKSNCVCWAKLNKGKFMSNVPPDQKERYQQASPDKKGAPTFDWTLTHNSILDTVKLIMPATNTVPIIFVPGIMGSNLKSKSGEAVWRLDGGTMWGLILNDKPVNLAKKWAFEDASKRQALLHPERVDVDPDGAVPSKGVGSIGGTQGFIDRGWGEVSETSYHKFLVWLEGKMNPASVNPANWEDFYYTSVNATPKPGQPRPEPKLYPGISMSMRNLPRMTDDRKAVTPVTSDDLLARAKHRFPVYACGYNWLASNNKAAQRLADRIKKVIKENNTGYYTCSQVILVTHSMGGLVARACSEVLNKSDDIAGIVHGVMPATGAAVAYRRCKIGMKDEDYGAALVIGMTGKEVTAVFAQAPGALQLLPSQDYPPGWLHFNPTKSQVKPLTDRPDNELEEIVVVSSLPTKSKPSPYESIYLQKDHWWGLVREEWLKPGTKTTFTWTDFEKNIVEAKEFHTSISGKYHANTYVYYGDDSGKQASFEQIHWRIQPGLQPFGNATAPTASDVVNMPPAKVRTDGSNAAYVGGQREGGEVYISPVGAGVTATYETSNWMIVCEKQNAKGDGTVPACSGAAPRTAAPGAVRHQFGLTGFGHEASYQNLAAQMTTLYSITKIAKSAKLPA
jgi:PGAP1-like protein